MGAAFTFAASPAQNHGPWTLEDVLRSSIASPAAFHGLSADVERTKVTVVVNDRSTDTGTMLVKGDKMLLQWPPDARTVLKTGDTLYVYTPGLKRVEEYSLGKNRALVDEFLLLGFGTPGQQLQQGYQVSSWGSPRWTTRKPWSSNWFRKTIREEPVFKNPNLV